MKPSSVWALLAAASALLCATGEARAQRAAVQLRARSDRGISLVACRGDRITSWLLASQEPPAIEWELSARCALGAVTPLEDGGLLYIDVDRPALVRVSSEGVERYRQPLSSAGWGAAQVLGTTALVRTSGGTVEWRSLEDGQQRFYRRTEAAADRRALLSDGGPLVLRQAGGERVCVANERAIECWRASDGLSVDEYPLRSSAALSARPLAVDLDNDGDDELVLARTDATVSAIDRRGVVRWSRLSPTRALVTAQPVVYSLAGALHVAWTDMDRWVLSLRASDGAAVSAVSRRVDVPSRAGLRVADVDGDGAPDLLVSGRNGALFAFSARDGSSTSLPESTAALSAIEGEPLLLVASDGAVQWLGLSETRALARRSFAPSALRESEALLVAQPDERLRWVASASSVSVSTIASEAVPGSATHPPVVVPVPREGGCSVRRDRGARGSGVSVTLLALAALWSARRRRR